MLRPYVITAHRRRSRDSDAPAVTHAEIRPRFFGGTGRLESPPFEGDRRPLAPRPRPVGAAVGLWRGFERTTVAFEWGRLKSAGTTEEAGANLRVRHRGRVGVAGTTAVGGDDVEAQHA